MRDDKRIQGRGNRGKGGVVQHTKVPQQQQKHLRKAGKFGRVKCWKGDGGEKCRKCRRV